MWWSAEWNNQQRSFWSQVLFMFMLKTLASYFKVIAHISQLYYTNTEKAHRSPSHDLSPRHLFVLLSLDETHLMILDFQKQPKTCDSQYLSNSNHPLRSKCESMSQVRSWHSNTSVKSDAQAPSQFCFVCNTSSSRAISFQSRPAITEFSSSSWEGLKSITRLQATTNKVTAEQNKDGKKMKTFKYPCGNVIDGFGRYNGPWIRTQTYPG